MVKDEVGADDVAEVVAAWTGIPAGRLLQGETEKLLHMEDVVGRRLIGQRDAVRAVSDAVRRARAGISDPDRPTGSFLFLGPTGVGKTELAKSLADFLFDDERAMVRIDMSEYGEKHSVARLVGAPPGYVGYEEGGQLTEAVRRRPYSVILLDEVEKAHPEVFDLLLQVLDDGRLTDGQGRTVDFRSTILVLTSNLGSQIYLSGPQRRRDEKREAVRRTVMTAVEATFKPEFINRLDDVIVFDALGIDELVADRRAPDPGARPAAGGAAAGARRVARRPGVAGAARVRPGVRRPAAAAAGAARDRRPARAGPAGRRDPRRRRGRRGRRDARGRRHRAGRAAGRRPGSGSGPARRCRRQGDVGTGSVRSPRSAMTMQATSRSPRLHVPSWGWK